jgi:hypothetical protein
MNIYDIRTTLNIGPTISKAPEICISLEERQLL